MACLQSRAQAEANRNAECESDQQRENPSTDTVAQLLRSYVNLCAGAEHQHGETERHERGQGLSARMDYVEPGAAEDDASYKLPN